MLTPLSEEGWPYKLTLLFKTSAPV